MRSAKWIVAMLLLAGVSLTAQESKPSKQSADCGDSLDSALELSGFNDSVKSMPVMVRQQVRQQAKLNKDLPDAAKEKLISLVTAAFDEEKIIESMKHKLSADCNPEMLNAAVVRLQGPLAQKARQQEAIAMTEEGQRAAPEYFRSLQKNAPDPDRVTLLERMDKDLNITDTTLNMVVAMTAGLAA